MRANRSVRKTIWAMSSEARHISYIPSDTLRHLSSLEGKACFNYVFEHPDVIKTIQDLRFVLINIPLDCRLKLAIKNYKYIENLDATIEIIILIPEKDRFEFAFSTWNTIAYEMDFLRIIPYLPLKKRLRFAQLIHSDLSTYFKKLFAEYTGHYLDKAPYKYIDDFFRLLPVDDRDFSCFDDIDSEKMQNFYDLTLHLKLLEASERLEQALIHFNHLTDLEELIEIIALLAENDRLKFALHHRDMIQDVDHFIVLLPENDRLEFAMHDRAKIQNIDHFIVLLPENDRLEFAMHDRAKIQNIDHLIVLLPENDRLEFAMHNRDKIEDPEHLIYLLTLLPLERRLRFARSNLRWITHSGILISVLETLTEDQRFDFALLNKGKYSPKEILALLRPGDRIKFIEFYDEFIPVYSYPILALIPEWDRLKILRAHADKVLNGRALSEAIAALPDSQKIAFFRAHQHKIDSIEDLSEVLAVVPKAIFTPKIRLELIKEHQSKITNSDDILLILAFLVEKDRIKFITTHKDKISGRIQDFLDYLPNQLKLEFTIEHHSKIRNSDELILALRGLPVESRPTLLWLSFKKIKNSAALLKSLEVLYNPGHFVTRLLGESSFEIKLMDDFRVFLKKYPNLYKLLDRSIERIRLDYLVNYNILRPMDFRNPTVQFLIARKLVMPNLLLWDAARRADESSFDFLLHHPHCSPLSFEKISKDDGPKNLAKIISESTLDEEVKKLRLIKVRERQEFLRLRRHYGLNLCDIKIIPTSFTGVLPRANSSSVQAVVSWGARDISFEAILNFRRLIAWLNTQELLSDFRPAFLDLAMNVSIRVPLSFMGILQALESWVENLRLFLIQNHPESAEEETAIRLQLAVHIDPYSCKQLGMCARGVFSSLNVMNRSLNKRGILFNVVEESVEAALRSFASMNGISEGIETHAPKDEILTSLGIGKVEYPHDPLRIRITAYNLKCISAESLNLILKNLLEHSLPPLEFWYQLKEGNLKLNEKGVLDILENDWAHLQVAGFFSEKNAAGECKNSDDKKIELLAFITQMTIDEVQRRYHAVAMGEDDCFPVKLGREEFKAQYQEKLQDQGILTLKSSEIKNLQKLIWRVLTDERPLLAELESSWRVFLEKSTALGWIKAEIDAHPERWDQIKLEQILARPKDAQSLFQKLASNPYYAGWLMGFNLNIETQLAQRRIHFNEAPKPFARVLTELAADGIRMESELEELFILPGNLIFFLGELQKDPSRLSFFENIISFLNEYEMYRFDNILDLLLQMSKTESERNYKTVAQSFLVARLEAQKALKLWSCYWNTACYLTNFELKFSEKDELLSLKDSNNARAALYLAGSNHKLALAVMKGASDLSLEPSELVLILSTIRGLYESKDSRSLTEAGMFQLASSPKAPVSSGALAPTELRLLA